jgi:hypothetical protein
MAVSAAHDMLLAIQIGAEGCGNSAGVSHCQPLLSWKRWTSSFSRHSMQSRSRRRNPSCPAATSLPS